MRNDGKKTDQEEEGEEERAKVKEEEKEKEEGLGENEEEEMLEEEEERDVRGLEGDKKQSPKKRSSGKGGKQRAHKSSGNYY